MRGAGGQLPLADSPEAFETLLHGLRAARALDLTPYKRGTLWRRVRRRMQQLNVDSFAAYLRYIEEHPEEPAKLIDTILINVTSFFRNPDAWQLLAEQILPVLLSGKAPHEPIRVWSVGCASGEEAFTLAILFAELLGPQDYRHRVKIYATDLDVAALDQARHGAFHAKQLESVPEHLRERYFTRRGARYAFREDLRRSMIFGHHDVIHDAPISHLDLIVCRNTLIYLNADAQARILSNFHYALNLRGFLFLGRADMLMARSALFYPVDIRHRVFSKTVQPELRARLMRLTPPIGRRVPGVTSGTRLVDRALDAVSHAQIVVDAAGSLTLANQPARRIFGLRARDIGRPLQRLSLGAQHPALRAMIARMGDGEGRETIVQRATPGGQPHYLGVAMTPLRDAGGSLLGASFTFWEETESRLLRAEIGRAAQRLETASSALESSHTDIDRIGDQLHATTGALRVVSVELERSRQGHLTTNVELGQARDTLRSLTEELNRRTVELQRVTAVVTALGGVAPPDQRTALATD